MSKKKKIALILKNFSEGINNDKRLKISYFDYEKYFYKNGDTIMPFRLKTPKNVEANKKYPLAFFYMGVVLMV